MCRLPGRTVCTLLGSAKRLCPRDDICIEMRTDYPCALSPRSAGGAQFSAARVSPTVNFYDAAQISRYGGGGGMRGRNEFRRLKCLPPIHQPERTYSYGEMHEVELCLNLLLVPNVGMA